MIFSRTKQQKANDQKQMETLREMVLADPEAHGLHGSLSDGINKERMLELAREYETKEEDRLKQSPRNANNQEKGRNEEMGKGPWTEEQRKNFMETMARKREARLTGKPDPSYEKRREAKRENDRQYHRRKAREKRGLPPEVHTVEELQIMDNSLHVHCMACGFRMEISADGIKALQKGLAK